MRSRPGGSGSCRSRSWTIARSRRRRRLRVTAEPEARDRSRRRSTSSMLSGRDTTRSTGESLGSERRHAEGVRSRGASGSVGSSRQSSAPLGAAVLDDVAAGAGAHPGTETVLPAPPLGVRLIGALHVVLLRCGHEVGVPQLHGRVLRAPSPEITGPYRPDKARGTRPHTATRSTCGERVPTPSPSLRSRSVTVTGTPRWSYTRVVHHPCSAPFPGRGDAC